MNKYQEAFERLQIYNLAEETECDLLLTDYSYDDTINDLRTIKELVDKETPMKPVYRIPDISWDKNEKLAHFPTCDWRLDWERNRVYLVRNGQADVIKTHIKGSINPDKTQQYSCPNCGRLWWEWNFVKEYCGHCGQKLDWSEDE